MGLQGSAGAISEEESESTVSDEGSYRSVGLKEVPEHAMHLPLELKDDAQVVRPVAKFR